tara:strand:+ start:3096 stop:4706 length:1611 start_codon:yes stop_codon:yes gene_type:complete
MIKRLIFLAVLVLAGNINTSFSSTLDTSYTKALTPFEWSPISDVDKVMQYENQKKLTKRSTQQAGLAAKHYTEAVNLMKNKDYLGAIVEFQAAMKRYKRAKLGADAMNFVHTNMALSYANSGNKQDLAVSNRLLNLITSKAYNDAKWAYNIGIAHYLSGNPSEAVSILSAIIRKDEFNFQAYVTLEAIFRDSGNSDDADRVIARMNSAEERLKKKNRKNEERGTETKEERKKKQGRSISKGKRPDVQNLRIVKTDDHLQFDNMKKIDERSMEQIQKGIADYELGVAALDKKEYAKAQKHLKNAEKKLKRAKVSEDGLNFSRGNLAIANLATKEKRGVGQAKRYLKYLTQKLYKTREWSYNMAVAYYQYAFMSARENRKTGERDWETTAAALNIKEAIKLFEKSIKKDRLFLPAYENLIYVYREQGEYKKALKVANDLRKYRLKLMQSFSKSDQLAQGGEPYIFRLNLGTFGDFDTPADLFDEANVITIPVSSQTTSYLTGLFYSLDEAIEYKEEMNKKGYTNAFIVAFKDGEKLEF